MEGKNPGAPKHDQIPNTLKEFIPFILKQIVRRRKWYLVPLWILLAVIGILLILSGGSHLLPAIYIAF